MLGGRDVAAEEMAASPTTSAHASRRGKRERRGSDMGVSVRTEFRAAEGFVNGAVGLVGGLAGIVGPVTLATASDFPPPRL